jgi:hypothetical protein
MDLTPEELQLLQAHRAARVTEATDRAALEDLLPRAKSTRERRWLQTMIAARGGPTVSICECGAPVIPESGTPLECTACFARGYGK